MVKVKNQFFNSVASPIFFIGILGFIGFIVQISWIMRGFSPANTCTSTEIIFRNFVRIVNCDEVLFTNMTNNPEISLTSSYVFQSRPLMGYFGYAINELFALFNINLVGINPALPNILLNFIILAISYLLFSAIIQEYFNRQFYVSLLIGSIFIFINPINKAFIWTAHSQMFNILIPILNVYILLNFLKKEISFKQYLYVAIVSLLTLAYSGFFVILVSLCLYLIAKNRSFLAFKLILLGLIPYLSYYFLIVIKNGNFYSHEVVTYRQFVWILDAIKLNDLSNEFTLNFERYLIVFKDFYVIIFIALFTLNILLSLPLLRTRIFNHNILNGEIFAFIFLMVTHLIFLFLLGFYASRLLLAGLMYLIFILISIINFPINLKKFLPLLFLYFSTFVYWIFINLKYPFPWS